MSHPAYPEHAKLAEVSEQSQAIGEFLEWIGEQGYQLQKWVVQDEEGVCPGTIWHPCDNGREVREGEETYTTQIRCSKCMGTGRYTSHFEGYVGLDQAVTEKLAEFFGINLTIIEQEKRAMLDSIRAQHDQEVTPS